MGVTSNRVKCIFLNDYVNRYKILITAVDYCLLECREVKREES